MQNTDQFPPLLNIAKHEKSALPLGYSQIYVKAISSKHAEECVIVYSQKYKKADLFSLASEKPISKMK